MDVVSNQFAPKEQSKFLEFCTGCPRLPVGGLAKIGKIIVVKKDVEVSGSRGGETPGDQYPELPSVNTCFKYLKLPRWSTRSTACTALALTSPPKCHACGDILIGE